MSTNQQYPQEDASSSDSSGIVAFLAVLVIVVLAVALIRSCLRLRLEVEEDDLMLIAPRRLPPAMSASQLRTYRGRTGSSVVRVPQPRAPTAVQAEPVVCTYSRADGWLEAECPVCLSEMKDGETVRVLPACMHYFHDACVGEWLRDNNSCPLCRAPPDTAAVAAAAV